MDTDMFWRLIENARAADTPLHEALISLLAARGTEQVLAFQARFDVLDTAVDRWDIWAAGYLIGGGCSDDRFMDFKAGLIALGRTWYERAADCPDDLAEHPDIRHATVAGVDEAVFYEEMGFVTVAAYGRITGDEDGFYPALDRYRAHHGVGEDQPHDMGADFDFDDAQEMRRRLPRLADLFLKEAQR
ncbi:DUF4240 domain-containing protein [Streptomyces sp. NPDC012403]|uniref:DUF4240 domain-containing protein n=1 Tax=unclassified Streptomyces TaxID=2593676 RepID=UPI001C2251BA|nr:DUF4240 domain-containing protein [Streptomyces sp. AC558_RSS880]